PDRYTADRGFGRQGHAHLEDAHTAEKTDRVAPACHQVPQTFFSTKGSSIPEPCPAHSPILKNNSKRVAKIRSRTILSASPLYHKSLCRTKGARHFYSHFPVSEWLTPHRCHP